MSIWNNADALELARLGWVDGVSASQIALTIARRFRVSVSRNAVIGIAHRKGWTKVRAVSVVPGPEPSAVISRAPSLKRLRRRPAPSIALADVAPLPVVPSAPTAPQCAPDAYCGDAVAKPASAGLTVLELTSQTCRWPGAPHPTLGFFFCGAQVGAGSYCPAHARMARGERTPRTSTYRPSV